MSANCKHRHPDGSGAISFMDGYKRMVFPVEYYGVCEICKKYLRISEEDYEEYLNGGDID